MQVIQTDREAAAKWCHEQPFASKQSEAEMISDGTWDHHSLVQAFAAYREQILEHAAQASEQWKSSLRPGGIDRLNGHQEASREIARMIRGMI